MFDKVIHRVEHVVDFHSPQGKLFGLVIMGILGAVLGGLFALVLATIGTAGVSSESLFIVAAGLLFLLFIDKMFL